VEVVDHDGGVRQAGAYGGAVGGGHVDGHVVDVLPPFQRGGGEPDQYIGDGAALDLAQQAAGAERVGEAGVPPVPHQMPLPGRAVLFPARPSAPGLVDAQHLHLGQGRGDDLAGPGAEGVHHSRPGQVQVAGGLDDSGACVAHLAPGPLPQSHGDPRPGPYLRDLLGERLPRAAGLAAEPAALVPAELQCAAVGQVAGAGGRRTLHTGGDHPADRAGPCRKPVAPD
jgi:hypothetical protein